MFRNMYGPGFVSQSLKTRFRFAFLFYTLLILAGSVERGRKRDSLSALFFLKISFFIIEYLCTLTECLQLSAEVRCLAKIFTPFEVLHILEQYNYYQALSSSDLHKSNRVANEKLKV